MDSGWTMTKSGLQGHHNSAQDKATKVTSPINSPSYPSLREERDDCISDTIKGEL